MWADIDEALVKRKVRKQGTVAYVKAQRIRKYVMEYVSRSQG